MIIASYGKTSGRMLSRGWVNSHCKHRFTLHSRTNLRVPRKPSQETNSVLPEPYARLLKTEERLKLIKKNENADTELKNEHTNKNQQRSRDMQEPVLWTRLIQSVTTMDILSPIENSVDGNLIIDDESKRSPNEMHVPDDVIELTTIVKRIRRRNERNTRPVNRSLNSINKNITNRRFKRSIMTDNSTKNGNSSDITNESTPSTDKLYRHPKLTYEDQETRKVTKEFSDIAKENNTNANEFTDFYKRIWDIINGTRPRFKIVVPSIKEPRITQAAIFKDEYTASASEVEDLNFPYNKTGDKKSLGQVPFDDKRPSQEAELEKYVKEEVEGIEDRSTLMPFEKLENKKPIKDRTYDPDYDRTVAYNPDEVPYAEDYNYPSSGSINESKEIEDQTADSPEEIDSSVENLNLSYNQTGSSNEDKMSSRIRELLNSVPEDAKEHSTLLSKNKRPVDEDQEIYDPDKIPYVEVPDYEDEREKSLDEQDRRPAKEENVEPLNVANVSSDCVGAAKEGSSTNSEVGRKEDLGNANLESYRNENSEKKLESPGNVQDDLNDTNENEDGRKEIQSREEKESDEESVLSVIPFDINEYRKPFNLYDFLKNEPFFAKLRKDKDYVRESSDRDEVTEGDDYSTTFEDDVSLDVADADEQDPRYERVLQDHSNRDIYDAKNATGSEDLYGYGDKDFFKRLFEENRKKRENFEMSAEEEDFLERYFTKDVIKKMREDSAEEELRETKKNEMMEKYKNKKDALKALSFILAKKDRISRLDEEVNKEIEDGQNTPSSYKNYWSLEYVLPGKNDQSSTEDKTASL